MLFLYFLLLWLQYCPIGEFTDSYTEIRPCLQVVSLGAQISVRWVPHAKVYFRCCTEFTPCVSALYSGSGWMLCHRACSTCKLHMSLQWARPASAASAPMKTRPRTLLSECTWWLSNRQMLSIHKVHVIMWIVRSQSYSYLHDYELEHEGQLTDVSRRKVKQERSVPHSREASACFSAANHTSPMMQIDHHLIFCTQKIWKIYCK